MYKTTAKIDGMACSMCEAHVNETVRRAFPVKKVTSSHKKGECVILAEEPVGQAELAARWIPPDTRCSRPRASPTGRKGCSGSVSKMTRLQGEPILRAAARQKFLPLVSPGDKI